MAEDSMYSLAQHSMPPQRGLFSQDPPPPTTRDGRNPTLLFSWWVTVFSAVIIIIRLGGRKTRSDKLFREDWIIMIALVPLFMRMAFIHVVLLYGTNNVQTVGYHFTAEELYHRSIGARLVLAGRISYALYIWTCKLMISEFLKRITIRIWRRSYEYTLQGIRIFLLITFILVVIATLSECQPFDHYWQVMPDPGPHCRQGYANLLTMGTCDMITDILLVAFPIPIIIRSGQTWRRKLQLSSLFSLSLIPIGITCARVVMVIGHEGLQRYRTVWASCEILAATAVANSVIIGSFLRDKGVKKNKYRSASRSESLDRASARRPTLTALQSTGSEEDLFRFLGIRVPEHLQEEVESGPRLAPAALPASASLKHHHHGHVPPPPPPQVTPRKVAVSSSSSTDSYDSLKKPPILEASPSPSSRRAVNFFDVGGLLEDEGTELQQTRSQASGILYSDSNPSPRTAHSHLHTDTALRAASDLAPPTPDQSRRGSHAFLQDIGGLLAPTTSTSRSSPLPDRFHAHRASDSRFQHHTQQSRHSHNRNSASPPPTGVLGPMLERHSTQQSLQDAGGLLSQIPEASSSSAAASPLDPRAFSHAHGFSPSSSSSRNPRRRRYRHDLDDDDDDDDDEGDDEDLMELTDLGSVLNESRRSAPDAGSGRSRVLHPRDHPLQRTAVEPGPSLQEQGGSAGGWESMRLQDAGDLLRR